MRRSVCFGGEGKGGAARYFRAELPAKALACYGWRTEVAQFPLFPQTEAGIKQYGPKIRGWDGEARRSPRRPATIVTLRIMDDVVVDPTTKRAAVNYRMDSMAADITAAREAGQVVLYDIDDDIWHIPEWSPAHDAMHKLRPNIRAYDLDVVNANIAACDGILTSTPYLHKVTAGFDVPWYLARPGIDLSLHEKVVRPGPHPLRVGWMGSMSHHLEHLKTMVDALDVLPKYGAEFMHVGQIRGDGSEVSLADFPCKVSQIPWGTVQELPQKLTNIDIGIIPRVDSDFNEAQSVTSGLQLAAAGVPFLVAPSQEYRRLEKLGAGKVCRTVADWRQALSDLLEFNAYRQGEAERAKECVEAEFGLAPTGRRYAETFNEILEKRDR